MVGSLKAETKEQIMEILVEKLKILSPDNDFADKETKTAQADYLKKHQQLLDSLSKDEIIFHLELASALYTNRNPVSKPHVTYAMYLYEKFHEDYTEEENEIISRRFNEFFEKKWVIPSEFEKFKALQTVRSTSASLGSGDKSLKLPFQSRLGDKPQQATAAKSPVEQASKSAEIESLSSSWRWAIAGGLTVAVIGLLWMWLAKQGAINRQNSKRVD
jgi:hypothetical protein